jgi:hypothetical protein
VGLSDRHNIHGNNITHWEAKDGLLTRGQTLPKVCIIKGTHLIWGLDVFRHLVVIVIELLERRKVGVVEEGGTAGSQRHYLDAYCH